MQNIISIFSETDHTNYDIFIIFVMSRGNAQGNIYCYDGSCMTVGDLMAAFVPSKCPSLSGKPKLVFIQNCRNEAEQKRAHSAGEREADLSADSTPWPHEADFLLVFFNPPLYPVNSYRNPSRGTPFIETLVDVVSEYHSTTDILDMLIEVKRQLAGYGFALSLSHTLRGRVNLKKTKKT